jgi:ATP-dependent phosphofructokinase / diphosphate-dependent phosphofructokinase
MDKKNIFFAHSGGVTAVVNTIAAAVISEAKKYPEQINKVLVGKNGILGAINEELIDTSGMSKSDLATLAQTPGSSFGSCRFKLKNITENKKEYERIIEVFKAHNIGYFLYNGGNDSQDTTFKIWQMSQIMNYPLKCIGIPKTVDNDLAITDCCPGFGSVAKYAAISMKEASLDVISMSATSTKVFVLELMGRHAGWITAAAGLASTNPQEGPHILMFPEVAFNKATFLAKVQSCVKEYGYCVIAASEGLSDQHGEFLAAANSTDAFGHKQLGGVAPILANIVCNELKLKTHWAVADYLQRSARHIASSCDVEQSRALGQAAVTKAVADETGIMVSINRLQNSPYKWEVGHANLKDVANLEKKLPPEYMTADKMHISKAAREYLTPLIMGEAYPSYEQGGLPKYLKPQWQLIPKKTA